jgi:hypothetical protein
MIVKEALVKLWAWTHWYGIPISPSGSRYGLPPLQRGLDGAIRSLTSPSRNSVLRLTRLGKCAYCGGSCSPNSTGDHIIPLSLGGPQSAENHAPSCRSCNSSKSDRDLLDWWIGQSRSVPDINLDVLRIYLRLTYQLLEQRGALDEEASIPLRTAVEQVRTTFNSGRLTAAFDDASTPNS